MSRDEVLERVERQNREILDRVGALSAELLRQSGLLQTVVADRHVRKEFYTVEEFAALVGRQKFTVRQWSNLGLIRAQKSFTRSGPCNVWVIAHGEYLRYQREGLLPDGRRGPRAAGVEDGGCRPALPARHA